MNADARHAVPQNPLTDTFGRIHNNLRISVTDRCNLRCTYCMPEEVVFLDRSELLTFEEMTRFVQAAAPLGIDKVRLTGGEPLLRRDVPAFVRMLAAKPGLADLALTTNGVLLEDQIDALKSAGLARITVSLDTLRRDRFAALTRFDQLNAVHAGIAAAHRVYGTLKIDSVVIRGVNDDELVDLVDYGRTVNGEVRFIEYMDVGGANRWAPARVFSKTEMLAALTRAFGPIETISEPGSSAPAERFALRDGTTFGIIASTTEPFCKLCDRSRLTADGVWYLCLYATQGLDLRGPLRRGVAVGELKKMIADRWTGRDDRGAEERLALGDRRAFVPVQDLLKRDPHLEMHTRGG
jgi:cyclic pyranopterin phosphate synthase